MVSTTLCLFGLLALVHYGESQVTWTTPSGGSGALATSAPEQDVTTATDLTDVTVVATATSPQTIASYAIPTNPGSKFAITGTTTGQLRLDANKGLDYEFQSAFVLVITATDNTSPAALVGTATVTLNVANIATDPVFAALYYCVVLPDLSAVGATVTSVPATYTGTGTLSYAVDPTTFDISSTGVVTVKTIPVRAAASGYSVILTVGTGTTTSSTLLHVCVGTTTQCGSCGSSGAAAVAFSLMSLFAALLVLVV